MSPQNQIRNYEESPFIWKQSYAMKGWQQPSALLPQKEKICL